MAVESFESLLDEAPLLREPSVRGELFLPASHMRLLEKLEHLSRYSHFVQAVVGLPGSGKTTLCKQFTPNADDQDVQACCLRGSSEVGERELLCLIADQLGLDVAADADENTLVATVLEHARLLAQVSRLFLIVVDDAEEFSEPALARLFLLLEQGVDPEARPHLVLFGSPRLKEILKAEAFRAIMSRGAHVMELEPLSFEEMQGFIAHRFGGEAGGLGERQLKKLYNDTFGLPGRIPQALERMLEQAGPTEKRKPRPRSGPVWGRIAGLVGVLALPVVAGWFWFTMQSNTSEERLRVLLPAPVVAEASSATPSPAVTEQETLEQRLEQVRAALERERASLGAPLQTAQAGEPQQPQPIPAAQPASPAGQLPVAPVREVSTAVVSAPRKRVLALPPPEARPVADAAQSAAAVAPVSKPSSSPGVAPQEQVLLGWESTAYTLQMLGARQEGSVARFVAGQSAPENFYRFSTIYKGKPWYVVVYGQYPDRDAAVSAIADLPVELRKRRPWARSVLGVQDDIRRKK